MLFSYIYFISNNPAGIIRLLANQNTAVSHLSITEGLHGLLDTFLVQGEGHLGRGDLLICSKLNQSSQTTAGSDQRSLDTDTLDVHEEQRNGRRREVNGKRVDGSMDVHQGNEAEVKMLAKLKFC
jgi:hypothetical protein